MIYTPEEYAKIFKFGGRYVSTWSIRRRCKRGQLPKGHIPHRKSDVWIIEVLPFSGLAKSFNVQLTLKKETV